MDGRQADRLSRQGIENILGDAGGGLEIKVLSCTDSTNAEVGRAARLGAAEGLTVIADTQTQGRGRRGRGFFSPPSTGLYLSLLLRPENCDANRTLKITTAAAVAVCDAISAAGGERAGIKWVNDVFMNGKKVCGILTESSLDQNGRTEYAVLGVGINLYRPPQGFPPELENIAGAVFDSPRDGLGNQVAAEFLRSFMGFYRQPDYGDYARSYHQLSIVLGRRVKVISASGTTEATVLDIDGECRLAVRYDDGSTDLLCSGEISIKL